MAVVNHQPLGTLSVPNVISGVTDDGMYVFSDDTPIIISFFDPSNSTVKAVTDFVSIRGDLAPLTGATATMEAFDVFGNSLGKVTDYDSSAGLTLSLTFSGIHSVLLTQNSGGGIGGTIGFDNLAFNSVVPVPLPAAVLLGILGLSAAGIKLRKFA